MMTIRRVLRFRGSLSECRHINCVAEVAAVVDILWPTRFSRSAACCVVDVGCIYVLCGYSPLTGALAGLSGVAVPQGLESHLVRGIEVIS